MLDIKSEIVAYRMFIRFNVTLPAVSKTMQDEERSASRQSISIFVNLKPVSPVAPNAGNSGHKSLSIHIPRRDEARQRLDIADTAQIRNEG